MCRVFARVGRAVAHHPRLTVVAWLVFAVLGYGLAVLGVHGENLFERLSTGAPGVPGSESSEAFAILDEADDSGPSLTLVLDGVDPADPDVATALAPAREDLVAIDGVVSVSPVTFQRRGDASSSGIDDSVLRMGRLEVACLDNDRNYPDRGVLKLDIGGGR